MVAHGLRAAEPNRGGSLSGWEYARRCHAEWQRDGVRGVRVALREEVALLAVRHQPSGRSRFPRKIRKPRDPRPGGTSVVAQSQPFPCSLPWVVDRARAPWRGARLVHRTYCVPAARPQGTYYVKKRDAARQGWCVALSKRLSELLGSLNPSLTSRQGLLLRVRSTRGPMRRKRGFGVGYPRVKDALKLARAERAALRRLCWKAAATNSFSRVAGWTPAC